MTWNAMHLLEFIYSKFWSVTTFLFTCLFRHLFFFAVIFQLNFAACIQVPEFRVAYTIVTDKLDTLYKKLKPKGVTMTALLAKAAGIALAKHPIMYAGQFDPISHTGLEKYLT